MSERKIKVLVVDDSALVRQVLTAMLNSDPAIEVVGTAQDPYKAREKIKALRPDVLTLDVEMPRMDGLTFLGNLMRLHPLPVVMVSSLTETGADTTLQALSLGAVDFVSKPRCDVAHALQDYTAELAEKVKTAAAANVRSVPGAAARLDALSARKGSPSGTAPHRKPLRTTESVIAVGASTGGTEAIKVVLQAMPADTPGIVISQHIPAMFSGPFAARMNAASHMTVAEARDGQQIVPGHVYIAPGDRHLLVERSGARYLCRLSHAAPVNRHRPSIDVMFDSVADSAGQNAVGILLTGMGADGAAGLKAIRDAGGPTVAQDEASSIVWGMPGEAVRLGAVDRVLALGEIAGQVLELVGRHAEASPLPGIPGEDDAVKVRSSIS